MKRGDTTENLLPLAQTHIKDSMHEDDYDWLDELLQDMENSPKHN